MEQVGELFPELSKLIVKHNKIILKSFDFIATSRQLLIFIEYDIPAGKFYKLKCLTTFQKNEL
ncbi:CLUMA_CG011235, isoform A [Clunio marinus]|uniref:CLUMA_CG011235, isoform A n=1 Tax=Clunio marinus TaxID=568069 RepID=A0A1J1IE77_9DIPT|nr:CLUMA_CG011235, isoform A [Clunio marinus]